MNAITTMHSKLLSANALNSSDYYHDELKGLTAQLKHSYCAIYFMHFPFVRQAETESQRCIAWVILGIGDDGVMHFVGASVFSEHTDNQIMRLLISLKLDGVRNITYLCTDFAGVIDEKPGAVFREISVHLMKSTLLRKTLHKISWKECPLVTKQINYVLSASSEEQGQMRRTLMVSQSQGKNVSATETLQRFWPIIRNQLSLPDTFRMNLVDNKLIKVTSEKIKKMIKQEQAVVEDAVLLNAIKDIIECELTKQHHVACLSSDIGISLLKAMLINHCS